ncbi:hypothetical protein [Paenisporosarcina quisquiliarum]|uniref:hypothetical protein n=1 Tax=Paenisporosarcina quisquiliarum TaxID=365346 RepID=UPI0037363409
MRNGFKYILTGYLLIFLDIHLIIDILPDPIGYFMILLGTRKIELNESGMHPTRIVATLLLFLSIPTVLINPQLYQNQAPEWWGMYTTATGVLDLILVYFLFQLIKRVVELLHSPELTLRTENTYKGYMVVMLIILFIQPFLTNLSEHTANGFAIFLVLAGFITQIIFLVFLRTLQKQFPYNSSDTGEILNLKV